jgi:hypothetical protein
MEALMCRIAKVSALVMVFFFCSGIAALALDPPKIALERVEVASIQPFYVKPKVMMPSKDDPSKKEEKEGTYGYSSTLNVAYILNITNPNKEPIMLDEISFTTMFDGFEVNTVTAYEDAWIPGGKKNQLRVIATNEAFPTIVSLSLGAANVERIKELKTSAGALVGKWWTAISDFSFPIEVVNGTAVFKDEKGNVIRATFNGKFGKEAAPADKKVEAGDKKPQAEKKAEPAKKAEPEKKPEKK